MLVRASRDRSLLLGQHVGRVSATSAVSDKTMEARRSSFHVSDPVRHFGQKFSYRELFLELCFWSSPRIIEFGRITTNHMRSSCCAACNSNGSCISEQASCSRVIQDEAIILTGLAILLDPCQARLLFCIVGCRPTSKHKYETRGGRVSGPRATRRSSHKTASTTDYDRSQ